MLVWEMMGVMWVTTAVWVMRMLWVMKAAGAGEVVWVIKEVRGVVKRMCMVRRNLGVVVEVDFVAEVV